eukprot:PITA_29144
MPGIDPSIVQHEIKTYENAKLIHQKLWPVNPRKAVAIKAKVEKLLKIVDECVGNEIFSFMDRFSNYNQLSIRPEDQQKTTFICPRGTFAYKKMPFGLKNVGATFQRAMSYTFHDIKHVIEAYLDDLATRSRKRINHPSHLRLVFERCRF